MSLGALRVRCAAGAACAASLLLAGAAPARAGAAAPALAARPPDANTAGPVSYRPPAPLQVVRRFDPPATRYGPGHLGVDLAVPAGDPVRAAGPGVVTFAGAVAGRGVVVITHRDGIRTEYEPVRPAVRAGAVVAGGQLIGVLVGRHRGCPVASCLHWGARRGDTYIDPLTLFARLGPVRLLPWRGG